MNNYESNYKDLNWNWHAKTYEGDEAWKQAGERMKGTDYKLALIRLNK